jgi:hypothetical protein
MLYGAAAFDETGMPKVHGPSIQQVADQTFHAIMFRAPGTQSTRLLEEGYAAKGFRIDTKSCDWGPMRGFVCVDERLSKVGGDATKRADNVRYTTEALEGRIRHDALGGLHVDGFDIDDAVMPDWMADCKPIVISAARFAELQNSGLAGVTGETGIIKGESLGGGGTIRFPWALIPIAQCMLVPAFAAACGTPPAGGYGVFVDHTNAHVAFTQRTFEGRTPPRVQEFHAVMGLINPDTASYGYRACVTGDYDLFGVWAPAPKGDQFLERAQNREWDVRTVDQFRAANPENELAHHYQHYRLGNITGRLNMIKVLLNTALIAGTMNNGGGAAYSGGNLIHHSDEIGNPSPGLRKSLDESFPILAFLPRSSWKMAGVSQSGMCLRNVSDFAVFVDMCRRTGIVPGLREEWVAMFP